MTGVLKGDRLERLYRLRDQVSLEIQVIEHERAMAPRCDGLMTTNRPPADPPLRPSLAASDSSQKELLASLGVTTHEVKNWAVATGLLVAVTRGRVARTVVDAYADAHPTEQAEPA